MSTSEITVGVTVDIPEPWRTRLRDARQSTGDTLAELVPPHLTLVAPTAVRRTDLELLSDHLTSLAASTVPFMIALHGIASFMPITPVAYVPVIEGGWSCAVLSAEILNGPVRLEQRFPFHPHVTIAQSTQTAPLESVCRSMIDFEAVFTIDRFALSVTDGAPGDPCADWRLFHEYRLGVVPTKDD
jgi:2'-5' RNA ligase